ncbi:hypothetical protein K4A83_22070 [Spirulina subsalsa FACHB-351]|uniref:Uncharacterized protein n=1 Tax=Spirulina subsalsa FACHB-351 TaxID=234711 RepID=A0ABT3LBM3_9CYAN|nr:hypothetical protein [Spirulina subsalsa]MCW6038917.1 hypothetical protein [Spirulina subsalsa FACHB-351]
MGDRALGINKGGAISPQYRRVIATYKKQIALWKRQNEKVIASREEGAIALWENGRGTIFPNFLEKTCKVC